MIFPFGLGNSNQWFQMDILPQWDGVHEKGHQLITGALSTCFFSYYFYPSSTVDALVTATITRKGEEILTH